MRQQIRILLSHLWLTLCLVTIALWLHSYHARAVIGHKYVRFYNCSLRSWEGLFDFHEVCYDAQRDYEPLELRFWLTPAEEYRQGVLDGVKAWGGTPRVPQAFTFDVRKDIRVAHDGRHVYSRTVTLPHWALVLLLLALFVVIRPPPRTRFGLRDLWVATTLLAFAAAGLGACMRMSQQ